MATDSVAVADANGSGSAPTGSTPAGGKNDSYALKEVTVTAEKRSVNLQKVPLAVTAISGDTLDKSNITDLSGLNGYVPGLAVEKSSGSELMISIRGVGSETPQNVYTQPGVSVFADGIYIPTALGVYQGFFDLDQIEVLRGPQGTLYGQSSTGGTININTKQPVLGKFGGNTEFSYGNYNLSRERADLNVPIGSTLAVRGAFQHYQHDGFGENADIPGYGLDVANDSNGKLAALWQPTDNFSATVTGHLYHESHNGAEQKNVNDPNPDPRVVEQDFPGYVEMDYQTYSSVLKYDLPFMTIKSITAYQDMDSNQQIDDDRLDGAIFGGWDSQAAWNSHLRATTQEINFISKPGGPLDWVTGFYYITQKLSQNIVELRGTGTSPTSFDIPPPTGPMPANIGYEENSAIARDSYAPFFQATYHLSDRFRLTGGARYNHDKYTGVTSLYYSPSAPVPAFQSHVFTGKGELEYDLAKNNMVYASWTRGYKPGGINNSFVDHSAVLVKQTFKNEIATSYEVGSKNRFLNNKLNLNLAGFYYLYNNLQYLSADPMPYQDGIANVPKTHIWGGELEASYLTMKNHLRINANLTALGGEFVGDYYALDAQSAKTARTAHEAANPSDGDFSQGTIDAVTAAAKNTNGNKPPKLPKLSGAINAAYTLNFGEHTLVPRVEYVYRGAFQYRVFNESALDKVGSYSIWNLYLDYNPPIQALHFSIAATNIGDRNGIGGRFTDPYGSSQTSNEFIAPRQVVMTAGYSF